jgi:hypothetical protein
VVLFCSPSLWAQCSVSSDGTAKANQVSKFTTGCNIEPSAITETAGKVGIGTNAPAATLDVKGTATIRGKLSVSGNSKNQVVSVVQSGLGNGLVASTSATGYFAGLVGISTSSNGAGVAGESFGPQSPAFYAVATGGGFLFAGSSCLGCKDGFHVDSAGNAMFGGNVNVTGAIILNNPQFGTGNYVCYANGLVLAKNTCAVSDENKKQAIVPLSDALAEVEKFQPVEFRYKPGIGYDDGIVHVGFTAQRMAEVDPRIVAFDDKGKPYAVAYENITAINSAAIQEMQKEIDDLKAELKTLRRQDAK